MPLDAHSESAETQALKIATRSSFGSSESCKAMMWFPFLLPSQAAAIVRLGADNWGLLLPFGAADDISKSPSYIDMCYSYLLTTRVKSKSSKR